MKIPASIPKGITLATGLVSGVISHAGHVNATPINPHLTPQILIERFIKTPEAQNIVNEFGGIINNYPADYYLGTFNATTKKNLKILDRKSLNPELEINSAKIRDTSKEVAVLGETPVCNENNQCATFFNNGEPVKDIDTSCMTGDTCTNKELIPDEYLTPYVGVPNTIVPPHLHTFEPNTPHIPDNPFPPDRPPINDKPDNPVNPVPEPSTFALMLTGLLALCKKTFSGIKTA